MREDGNFLLFYDTPIIMTQCRTACDPYDCESSYMRVNRSDVVNESESEGNVMIPSAQLLLPLSVLFTLYTQKRERETFTLTTRDCRLTKQFPIPCPLP